MPRVIAISSIILGILGALFAFNMSISAPGTNIANLSLMAERQNVLLVAAVFVLAGTILFAADHVRGGTPLTTPAQRRTLLLVLVFALTSLACVWVGFRWQNEVLAFGPFWLWMAFQVWKARTAPNQLIKTAAIILGLAVISFAVTFMFVELTEPAFPKATGHLFPSHADI